MPRFLTGARRRNLAVVAVAATAVSGLAVARAGTALAESRASQLSLTCETAGLGTTVSVPMTAADTPDPAVAGGPVVLTVQAAAPSVPGLSATVTAVEIDLPLPAQVASVASVTYAGGNLTGSHTEAPGVITVRFTGSAPSGAAALPAFALNTRLRADATGSAVWAAPSRVSVDLLVGDTMMQASCVPAAGTAALNATTVGAVVPTTTTTTSTTATTAPTTSTTAPTTSTTTAPTTTAPTTSTSTTTTRPTTTTTRPTTTTTRPTTTTTRPTTTTTRRATTTTTRRTTTTTRPRTTTTRPRTTTTRPRTTTTTSPVRGMLCRFFRFLC
jgi:hypothetical protein